MHTYLQKIATGPEMSRDLSAQEARTAMDLILDGTAHPVQAAVFLIALRMKRESDDESWGVLSAIRDATGAAAAQVEDLMDISDPYDGFVRHLPASPFLPAVLAACGLPAVSHGLERLGPKYGVTHRQVLAATGCAVDLDPQQAAARIADPDKGWAYVDQSQTCPGLHALAELRTLIVKRTCVNTVEGLAGPVRALGRTHLLRGYVHEGYKAVYRDLARRAGFATALITRGMEGGVIPLLNKPAACSGYDVLGRDFEKSVEPGKVGISTTLRAAALPQDLPKVKTKELTPARHELMNAALAEAAARAGILALQGHGGATRDSLVFAGALCLKHAKRFDSLIAAADAVRKVLDSGLALACLHA